MSDSPQVQPLSIAPEVYSLFCHDLPTRPLPGMGKILVSGASGYIGGRLIPELVARNYQVRAMVRADISAYSTRWPDAEVVEGNALNHDSLRGALKGIDTAYYLIHSLLMGPRGFEVADIDAAVNFCKAASQNEVKRIIYLGGLGDSLTSKSHHLRSRIHVAEELQQGPVPVTILRAAIIIGSGSASYEIIRHLANRMPVLFIPRWARNRCQPIAIRDVIKYLVGVIETPETAGRALDIGGPEILTYEGMLRIFAEIIHKKVRFVSAPISYLHLYAYAVSLLTPVPAPITMALMEGLKDEVVCRNNDIRQLIPLVPLTYREAVIRALTREEQDRVYTRWSDAYPPAHELAIKLSELRQGTSYSARDSLLSDKSTSDLFRSISKVGGKQGWFHNNWIWHARGSLDRILFGVGSQRGRKSASSLQINDVIDFWRVEDLKKNERLLLRSELKMPGRAWLELTLREEDGKRRLSIAAYFEARGFFGKIYWYIFWPFHKSIFRGLIEQIERRT